METLKPHAVTAPEQCDDEADNADLIRLFRKYGTDKLVNGYTHLYHTLFHERRERVRDFLEIGIGTMIEGVASSMVGYVSDSYTPGGSLRAWRDYFPDAKIVGVDVQPDTQFQDTRIETLLCDSMDADAVARALGDRTFQIIIDDGTHIDQHQLATLRNMYPRLDVDGLYIIEDIYPGSSVSESPDDIRKIVGHNEFFFVGRRSNLCVILNHPLTDYERASY